jgi:hypothetical protein
MVKLSNHNARFGGLRFGGSSTGGPRAGSSGGMGTSGSFFSGGSSESRRRGFSFMKKESTRRPNVPVARCRRAQVGCVLAATVPTDSNIARYRVVPSVLGAGSNKGDYICKWFAFDVRDHAVLGGIAHHEQEKWAL